MQIRLDQIKLTVILILLTPLFLKVAAQSKVDLIIKNGYEIGVNQNDKHTGRVLIQNHAYSENQFSAIISSKPFNYFKELKQYSTPLDKKIYKKDNPIKYKRYLDSLVTLKKYLKSSYEVLELEFSSSALSEYDIQKKCFYNTKKHMEHFFSGDKEMLHLKSVIKTKNHVLLRKEFFSVPGITQKWNKLDNVEHQVKTTFAIENERNALLIEEKGLQVLIIYNRFDVSGKVYKPRKVLYLVEGRIIQDFGTYNVIDSLINVSAQTNKPLNEDVKSTINELSVIPEKEKSLDVIADDTASSSISKMPIYPECAHITNGRHRRTCMTRLIREKVASTYNMPDIAREMGYEDIIFISFIVNKQGNIEDVKVVSGKHEILNKEAVHAVSSLPRLIPGMNLGEPTAVKYTIPIRVKNTPEKAE